MKPNLGIAVCMLLLVACGGGGGSSGPTAPNGPANVAGTWNGTSTATVTSGLDCFGKQPLTVPAVAQISQNGTSIAVILTLNHAISCSSHGTVSDTMISLTQDSQQSNPNCLVTRGIPCFENGAVQLIDLSVQATSLSGTVSGNQISATGTSTTNILDSRSQQVIGALQGTVQLTLQRQ